MARLRISKNGMFNSYSIRSLNKWYLKNFGRKSWLKNRTNRFSRVYRGKYTA